MRALLVLGFLAGCPAEPAGDPPHTDDTVPDASDSPADSDTDPILDSDDTGDRPTFAFRGDTSWWSDTGGSAAPAPVTELCSGSGWCAVSRLPHGNVLRDVDGSGPDDVWVVGGAATVQHWDGQLLVSEQLDVDAGLAAVVVAEPGQPCVAGTGGVVWCREDGAWRDVSPPGTEDLVALARTPGGVLWAVGPGAVWSREGSAWTRHPGGATALAAPADDHVWLADPTSAVLRRWDGEGFVEVPVATGILDVAAAGPDEVYALTRSDLWRGGPDGFEAMELPPLLNLRILYALHVIGPGHLLLDVHADLLELDAGAWSVRQSGWWDRKALWGSDAGDAWLVDADGHGNRVADGVITSLGGGSLGSGTTLLAERPGGTILYGGHGVYRTDGQRFGWVHYGDVRSLVADGRSLWMGEIFEGLSFPSPTLTDVVHQRESAGSGWFDVGSGGWKLRPSSQPGHVWSIDQCEGRHRTRGGVVQHWPPTPPPGLSRCDLHVFEPNQELWGAGWSYQVETGTVVVRYDGTWTVWPVPFTEQPWVARRPDSGEPVVIAPDGAVYVLVLGAWTASGEALGVPGDRVASVSTVPGEVVVSMQRDGGRPAALVRWDGQGVVREVLPTQHAPASVIVGSDGRWWASINDQLLVNER